MDKKQEFLDPLRSEWVVMAVQWVISHCEPVNELHGPSKGSSYIGAHTPTPTD
jgi:hypothetical protein